MSPRSVARDHYAGRQRLVNSIARFARQLWRQVDGADLDRSWPPLMTRLATKIWTYEEYLALPDDGNRYEIIEGELIVAPPPTHGHTTRN